MNIFTDILFLLAYLLAMFFFELPDVKNKNYPVHKLLIFISTFVYYYVVQLIKKIKNKCTVDPMIILNDAFMMGLYCVLGYSLYVDFMYWDYTKSMFGDIKDVNIIKRYVIISVIIVSFVTIVQASKLLFKSGNSDECDGGQQQMINKFF